MMRKSRHNPEEDSDYDIDNHPKYLSLLKEKQQIDQELISLKQKFQQLTQQNQLLKNQLNDQKEIMKMQKMEIDIKNSTIQKLQEPDLFPEQPEPIKIRPLPKYNFDPPEKKGEKGASKKDSKQKEEPVTNPKYKKPENIEKTRTLLFSKSQIIMSYVRKTPRTNVAAAQAYLCDEKTLSRDVKNPQLEILYRIYLFMHLFVAYDFETKNKIKSRPQDPEGVLKSGYAVCDGFSQLYIALINIKNVKGLKLIGHSKTNVNLPGSKTTQDHAWVGVEINDSKYLVDPCWGAGFGRNNEYVYWLDNFWFLTPAEHFIYTHFPIERQNEWQLLPNLWEVEKFDSKLNLNTKFFWQGFTLKNFSDSNSMVITEARNTFKLQIPAKAPCPQTKIVLLDDQQQEIPNSTYAQLGPDNQVEIFYEIAKKGQYYLRFFYKPTEDEKELTLLFTYSIFMEKDPKKKGIEGFPQTFGQFQNNRYLLLSPIKANLQKGKQNIQIQATNNQVDLGFIQGDDIVKFSKGKNGLYECNANVKDPKALIQIGIYQPKKRNFDIILTYNNQN